MEDIENILSQITFEHSLICDYVWKSPNFIEHETELEKRKLNAYFPDDERLANLRWSLESLKLEHVYPKAISMGNMFYVSSWFETYMLRLAMRLDTIVETSFSEQRGQGMSKILNFLKSCDIHYFSSKYWMPVDSMLKIRNCLVHASGNLSFSRNQEELRKIVEGNLYLNPLQREALKRPLGSKENNDVHIDETELGTVLKINNMCAYIALSHYKDLFEDICKMIFNLAEKNA